MIKQISDLVKQYGNEAVVNNPDIPNEENSAILAEATNTITGGMQNMLAGGGLKDIIAMFTGASSNEPGARSGGIGGLLKSPIVAMMVGHLVSKLVGKFRMNPSQASGIANNLIPNVLNGLVTRTSSNDPENDAFDLNDLIGSLTGGNVATSENVQGGFNFQEMLDQVKGGGNASAGGGFDLQDIISQVTQGALQNKEQQAKSGSGLVDLVKGFFN
jgi:hypothetical protein